MIYSKNQSINSVNLPNISLDNNLFKDQSKISISPLVNDLNNKNRFRDAEEIRTKIGRLKMGIQSADPSKRVELRTSIGFKCNKFESLKGASINLNKSIY